MYQRFLLASLVVASLVPSRAAADAPKVGDKVWAQWKPNDWYPGKVAKACPTGLHVVFDDGDEADLAVSLIAVDECRRSTTSRSAATSWPGGPTTSSIPAP